MAEDLAYRPVAALGALALSIGFALTANC